MWSGSSRQGKKKEKQFFSVLNKPFRVRVPCQRRGNQRRWRSSSSSASRRGSTGCGMAGRYGASKTKAGQETLAETLANLLFLFLLATVIVLASSYCTPGINKEHYWSNASFSFLASERWRITVICPPHYPDVAVWLTGCPPAWE